MSTSRNKEAIQIHLAEHALNTLRQIRGSVFERTAHPNQVDEIKKAVEDAEQIGQATAEYLVDPLNGSSDLEKKEALTALLNSFDYRYGKNRAFSTYEGAAQRKVEDFLPTKMDAFSFLASEPDPSKHPRLWEVLIENYNICLMPDINIFRERLGVVSPLSSDYLSALLLKRFIEVHTTFPCFQLKPLILNGSWFNDLGELLDQKDPIFEGNVDEIVIWTNIDVSYRTRTTATDAVRMIYPRKLTYGAYPL